jgi:DNA-binding CsgD family transcriptional regulator
MNVLNEVPSGSHVCMFYDSTDDLLDVLVPFFKIGTENNELCLWCPPQALTVEEARTALRRHLPQFDRHLSAGNIEIISNRELYLIGDRFDVTITLGKLGERMRDAMAKGYRGLRASGDASWIKDTQFKDFCAYEHALTKALKGNSMMALCTYPINMSKAEEASEVVRAHHLAVVRRNGDWGHAAPAPAGDHLLTPHDNLVISELLSPREQKVINLIAQGRSNKEIARSLGITPETVKSYVRRIFDKLNVDKRSHAVSLAQSLGIVNME